MDGLCGKIFSLNKPVGAPGFLNKPPDFFHIFFKADRPAVLIHSIGLCATVHPRRFQRDDGIIDVLTGEAPRQNNRYRTFLNHGLGYVPITDNAGNPDNTKTEKSSQAGQDPKSGTRMAITEKGMPAPKAKAKTENKTEENKENK